MGNENKNLNNLDKYLNYTKKLTEDLTLDINKISEIGNPWQSKLKAEKIEKENSPEIKGIN